MSFSRSLSFLDLITCGFGAILLLFLVMLVTVDDLRISENNNPQPSPSPQQKDVPLTAVTHKEELYFIAWIEFSEPSSGKNQSSSIKLFEFIGGGPSQATVTRGNDFLVVYCQKKPKPSKPPENPKKIKPITVKVLSKKDRLRFKIVAVIDGEMKVRSDFLKTTDKKATIELWPSEEGPQ